MNPTLQVQSTPEPVSGYDFGRPEAAHSPISIGELREIEETVGWGEQDFQILRSHGDIFERDAEKMVDAWRAIIAKQPHLAKWFFGPDGKPDEAYKAKVKKRFVQWVLDVCFRPHDQAWLDYQYEIGLRHTPDKKNATDGAHTASFVPLRYLLAFVSVVAITTRTFFVEAGLEGEELQKLCDAWLRAVQLHVTMWTLPYAKAGLW